jgi:NTE family protein
MRHDIWTELLRAWLGIGSLASNLVTTTQGIPAFFRPNPRAFLGVNVPLGPETAGYYDTSPLMRTLSKLVNYERINERETRLTVGAANVRTSEMRYFDSRDMDLDIRHVMASGELPPAFPAVRIDGDLYWDGGILSNTPVEAVFDDNPRQNSLSSPFTSGTRRGQNRRRSGSS